MKRYRFPLCVIGFILIVLGFPVPETDCRTRLVALPQRDQVTIRLAETGDRVLVQEQRVLTLVTGVNPVDFSWQNVLIDPDSIHLDTLADPREIRVLSVAYPPGESALVWEIYSDRDRDQAMIISYLLAGLDSLTTYTAQVDAAEQHLKLTAHLVIRNFSGEQFAQATAWVSPARFYTLPLENQETRQIRMFEKREIPLLKVYDWDGDVMPHDPENHPDPPGIPTGYEITNTADSGLGQADLAPGKARVFQDDGYGTRIFSGEDLLRFVPRGDKGFFRIGNTRDILVTKRRMSERTTQVRRNDAGVVQVYDQEITDRFILENTKDIPVSITLTDRIPGPWEPVEMGHAYTLKDYETLEFSIRLEPKEKKNFDLVYRRPNILGQSMPGRLKTGISPG